MTAKNLQAKVKHHHVWANYLSRWASENNIWYTTIKGKVAFDSVRGLACENYFYKATELTSDQITIIQRFSMVSDEWLHKQHMKYLNDFLNLQYMQTSYASMGVSDPELEKMMHAAQCNLLENLHTRHENDAYEILESLITGDLKILDDRKMLIRFCIYLGHQITRTKSFREKVKSGSKIVNGDVPKLVSSCVEDCWWFLSYMFGMNVGYSLYLSWKDSNHCLIVNDTNEPFITSDEPIINVHSCLDEKCDEFLAPEYADFYYPLSPSVAFMINDSNNFGFGKFVATERLVHELNLKMAKNSYKHIFSNTDTLIKKYRKYVGEDFLQKAKLVKE